jgi:CubicO group peptidase (beta-lactamase class C family)
LLQGSTVATSRVTLRDLLSHRTGVPRQDFLKMNAPGHRTDLLQAIRYFEPAAEFRSGFRYCNETVTVAGDLLAQRAGTTWEALIRERIFTPLGMTRSVADVAAMKANGNYAYPYIIRRQDPEEMAFYDVSELRGPAGAVISSANDMARWLIFNLDRGQVNGKAIVPAAALAQLFVPQVPATVRAPRYPELTHQSYGLGWFVDTYRGSLRISHPGSLYGFSSMVSFLPRERLAVVVLANLHATPLTEIVERFVYDGLLGLPSVDWNQRTKEDEARARAAYESQAASTPAPATKAPAGPARPIEAYLGTFSNAGYGTVTIERTGEKLSIHLRSGSFPLAHITYDVFEFHHPVEDQTCRLVFRSGFEGEIESVAIDAAPGLSPLVFERR